MKIEGTVFTSLKYLILRNELKWVEIKNITDIRLINT